MIYLQLFWRFFLVGLFSFGGGYAAIPLIQHQVVETSGWLTLSEFTDLVAISQMTPGPLAINAATFVGTQVAGFPGAVVSTLGCILAPCAMVSLLALLYSRYRELCGIQGALSGLRSTIVAFIFSAGSSIVLLSFWGVSGISFSGTDWIAVVLFTGSLVWLRRAKPNPIFVMLACGAIGGSLYLLTGRP